MAYVNALPLNAVQESDAALVSGDLDDLEVAETKHHYKKKQVHYQQRQPVYIGEFCQLFVSDD